MAVKECCDAHGNAGVSTDVPCRSVGCNTQATVFGFEGGLHQASIN
jgi:hypothetical protein